MVSMAFLKIVMMMMSRRLFTCYQLRNYSKHPISGGSGCSNGINGFSEDSDDDDEPETIHLLPNILIGTGKYCRSSKYHDKAVDTAYLTDNGYLITAIMMMMMNRRPFTYYQTF